MSTVLREKLYKALDRVVDFNALSIKEIPHISLSPSDYQLFKQHNKQCDDGFYRYRNLTIRGK